ncbi:glycosyltransferase family 4 protein [Paenibacillus marinisediminis]
MKMLFTFYVPSGGIDTLNRLRGRALQQIGVYSHLLYTQTGSGLQNSTNLPTYVTSSDHEIQSLLQKHNFEAILVSSDFIMLERLRRLGYHGPLIYEAQGLGAPDHAEHVASQAAPYIQQYAQGIHLPATAHLIRLFEKYCPAIPRYVFSNVVDYDHFHYQKRLSTPRHPIISWIGRLEPNKNWDHFLDISHQLILRNPRIRLWMFLDNNLSQENDYKRFSFKVGKLDLKEKLTIFNNIPHARMMDYLSKTGDSGGFLMSTSILEGFGYSIAEALSCRCPVLCSDSDGVKVFIQHNVTGKFYTHNNIQQAIQEGVDLLNNASLRDRIRKQGVQHMKQNFQPKVYAQHFSHMLNVIKQNYRPI